MFLHQRNMLFINKQRGLKTLKILLFFSLSPFDFQQSWKKSGMKKKNKMGT